MIVAVDKGTTFTKTENILFKSTIREYQESEIDFSQNKIIVKYNNKKYVIGEKGKTNTNLFKSKQEETKLLILTAIALNNPYTQNINLVTGLPIGRYADEREHMKNLFQNTNNRIIVNNEEFNIRIQETEVFPEGASSFYMLDEDEGFVIDIGGLSVDCALFTRGRVLSEYSTYKLGVMPLYRKIANKLNNEYSLNLNEWDIENIIVNGLTIEGKVVETNFNSIVTNHIQEILQAIEFEYDLPIIKNIFLTGGGSIFLYSYFKKRIPRINLMPNSQFTNVESYKILGEVLFNEQSQRI